MSIFLDSIDLRSSRTYSFSSPPSTSLSSFSFEGVGFSFVTAAACSEIKFHAHAFFLLFLGVMIIVFHYFSSFSCLPERFSFGGRNVCLSDSSVVFTNTPAGITVQRGTQQSLCVLYDNSFVSLFFFPVYSSLSLLKSSVQS